MRTAYALKSIWQLKRSIEQSGVSADYWQAGRSVETIDGILPVAEIVTAFRRAWDGETA